MGAWGSSKDFYQLSHILSPGQAMFYIGLALIDLGFISSLVLICSVVLRELVNPQEPQVPGVQAGNDASLQGDF